MLNLLLLFIALCLCSCGPQPTYSWQDARESSREDPSIDLEECREYAARQYKPGMPAGEAYLKEKATSGNELAEYAQGKWRPDRSPFNTTNLNSQPIHDIPTEHTGYPGELDYYPSYLDDILEKCMSDRGWAYWPMPEGSDR
jgi:hypothetical protein